MPSHLHIATTPTEIQTLLGSCVAVCLVDTTAAVGGMNHFMLPSCPGGTTPTPRYGDVAIQKLIEGLLHAGASEQRLQAKLFGGAEQFGAHTFGVGRKNIACANVLLNRYNIPIVSTSVGGTSGRRIIFSSDSGVVHMRYLNQVVR